MGARGTQVSQAGKRRQIAALLKLLAAGHTVRDAAEKAGVSKTAVYLWAQKDPGLQAALRARDEFGRAECRAVLAEKGPAVLESLARIATSGQDEGNRIKAAAVLAPLLLPADDADDAPLQLQVQLAPRPQVIESTAETPALEAGEEPDA